MVKKIRVLNLRIKDIDADKIIEILEKISNEVDRYIREKTPPKTDYDFILSVDKSDELTLVVDIGIIGSFDDVFDYKTIVNDIVNLSRRIFEKELEKYRMGD